LLGRQVGASKAGEYVHRTNKDQTMFRHNPDSFRKMWEEVGKLTNTEWRVEVEAISLEMGNAEGIRFVVFRES